MIRKKKKYSKPRKLYELGRIKEENALKEKYALKNKREIWKTLAKVNYFRGRAMALAKSNQKEQDVFLNKLKAIGLKTNTLTDVLDLKIENLLERRLPTIVAKKTLANTTRHARQMVVHKKVLVKGKVINSPSYLVPVDEEKFITTKTSAVKQIKENKGEIPMIEVAE
ncbi:30S ribosomal protein S4 [Candidatus Pacearchaeota archaeon]|nr:30S ribosomal protein S4 [Candidatus Pacearchaeota archaeon]